MKAKIVSILSSVLAFIAGCFGSCGVACLASGCCGSYLLLGFIGISGSTLSFLGSLTPVFLGLTVVSLGFAFYVAYKPKKQTCCETTATGNSACCEEKKKTSFFKSKTFLWVTTVFCIVMWTYPMVFGSNKTVSNPGTSCCPTQQSTTATSCCPAPTDSAAAFKQIEIKTDAKDISSQRTDKKPTEAAACCPQPADSSYTFNAVGIKTSTCCPQN